ncbi:MAG: asparagine synthase (glutamine-hydrolyzing) [Acidobacteriota bacterium]
MCGLTGIAFRDASQLSSAHKLLAMRDVLHHRGPDDAGHYLAPGIALASRRLAILDLSERGHMPMSTPDGRYWIAYNGEVYNYRELRPLLEARGYQFRSGTDTEVLLYLYAEEGARMLDRLNGMFAFAIWDTQERTLFIARDRLGIKPLYYSLQPEGLYFGSEEKALFAAGVPAQFDPQTWDELLCFRYVAGEDTPFVGVKRLLPGHYLTWREGDLRIKRWWNLAERARERREQLPENPIEWFRETFDAAVGLRRISDVPVGVLLSGGLDSSSVAASLALQAGADVATFTVRFDEAGYDEGPLAQELAAKWKLNYNELRIDSSGMLARLQQASWLNDEPLAHGSDLYLLAISEYAKPKVTVLLSGEGADETLGGYVRYQPLQHPALLKLARPVLPSLVAALHLNSRMEKLSRFLELGSVESFVLFNACDVLPSDLVFLDRPVKQSFDYRETVLAEARSLYPDEPMRQAMYSDQHTFMCSLLDRNDRMTMGASIECRVPFLDYRLVETLAAMPSSQMISKRHNKQLMRQAVGNRLTDAIQQGRKWGFGVPWNRYLREVPEFRQIVINLPELAPINDGPFIKSKLSSIIKDFLAGDNHYESLIRQLVMIAVWQQTYFAEILNYAPNLAAV